MRRSGPLELRRWSEGRPGPGPGPGVAALHRAAEMLQLRRDFPGALAASQRGLELEESGSSTVRSGDVKFSLCIIGIQALAELNHWDQVLGWVLEIYEIPEKIPVKILQICIVLYSKVGEPSRMQQIVGSWLKHWTSPSALGCGPGLVLELYLLHVLLPLGLYAEAEELILETALLTDQQRGTVLQVIENRRSQQQEQVSVGIRSHVPAGSSQHRHPASPAAISWLTSLQNIIRQIWKTMFAPYNKARICK
ncbi:peroxisome assembly protein 26 isoform X2 [Cetorhinus maximus]